MSNISTHILDSPAKRGGWAKRKRYDVTLTIETVDAVKQQTSKGEFSGLVDGLLAGWLKRNKHKK